MSDFSVRPGEKIEYTVRRSRRAKRWRLTLYAGGRLVVTSPADADPQRAEDFILKNKSWLLKKLVRLKGVGRRVRLRPPRGAYKKYGPAARALAAGRVSYFNRFYGFKVNRITVKNQKTRWGSCSKLGNLNFNYKILWLPPLLADYLVVHELCHLGQFNHSNLFWGLMARALPDYKARRRALKKISF